MDADGSNVKRLTNGENDSFPICAATGKWVYFNGGNKAPWMRVTLDGTASEQLHPHIEQGWGVFPISGVSPDDRHFVSYSTRADAATSTYTQKLGIFRSDSAESPVQTRNPNLLTNVRASAVFTPDGQALAYGVTTMKITSGCSRWTESLAARLRNFAPILFGEAAGLRMARSF